VKLASTTRLRIATILITTFLTAGIGSFAAFHTYAGDKSEIDSSISGAIRAAQENPSQELSAGLFYLDQYSLDFSLYLISRDGNQTTVNESSDSNITAITIANARAARQSVIQASNNQHTRFKSLEISGGDFLVVAASTREADSSLYSNLRQVAIFTFSANILAFFILSLYIRRLQRRDDQATLARMQEFLGDASHELRTPLTVIKGYVEMLSKGQIVEAEGQSRAFSRVNGEILRMESLIHDLLLLAELGESATRDSYELDLSAILRAHSEDFLLLHPTRTVEIEIVPDLHVLAVEDHLSRFIQNALGNIDRHTQSDIAVKVSLEPYGKQIRLIIEDGGSGLPGGNYDEKVRSLHRFDKSRTREHGGSGLGMSIMAAVVAKHGGEFSLQKSALGGLAVIALLPRITS
jgi:K+-sensing histidine kinase KdpD